MIKFLIFCLLVLSVKGFTQSSTEIPTLLNNPKIVLDTIFYASDKPLPFDRQFILQFTYADKVNMTGFSVIPINGRGEQDVKRRDYRRYIRSITRGYLQRRKAKKTMSYASFADSDPEKLYPDIETDYRVVYKDKKSEITLLMPALEPRRDYKLKILTNEGQVLEFYFGLNSLLYDLMSSPTSVDQRAFVDLKKKYEKLEFKYVRKDDLFQFLSAINCKNDIPIPDSVKFTVDNKLINDKFQQEVEIRFIFSKNSVTKTQADALKSDSYLSFKSDHLPRQFPPAMLFALAKEQKILDASGSPIIFSEVANKAPYRIYLWAKGSSNRVNDSNSFPYKDTLFTKLSEVVFLGNDTNIIGWEPIKESITNCESSDISSNLTLLNNNLPIKSSTIKVSALDAKTYKLLVGITNETLCKDDGNFQISDCNDLIKVLGFIYKPVENYFPNVGAGLSALNNPNYIVNDDLVSQSKNLDSSLKSLNLLESLLRMAPALTSDLIVLSDLETMVSFLKTLRSTILENKNKLEKAVKAEAKIKDYYLDNTFMGVPTAVSSLSTEVFNFMTASKFKIVPDFGFVVISNFPNKGLVTDLVPYLGFNINFRSIDKDIPMNKVKNKYWTYYFSFIAGLTLTSLKIDRKREDLFINNSLMGGFGFRVNNYLKVIGGSVFYKKMSINPLSDKKSIGASPFVGLSIDYELRELFGGIKNLFK